MISRAWMEQGTALFLQTLEGVNDDQLSAPSGLPGWTGRHLVAHVHYNALALSRLVSWAATGVESRMYTSPEQRGGEIQQGAQLPAAELRDLVRSSADQLAADLDGLSPQAWEAEVITAQGRIVPASEIPWMRTREVYVHAADLGAGFDAVPDDVTAALLVDVVRKRVGAGEGAGLAAWLTGRTSEPPPLGRWL